MKDSKEQQCRRGRRAPEEATSRWASPQESASTSRSARLPASCNVQCGATAWVSVQVRRVRRALFPGNCNRPEPAPAAWAPVQESGSDIVVNHLIRGGSAERSGKVLAGDVIVAIDDKDVRGKGVSEMRNFIVGPEGSTVRCLAPPAPLQLSYFAASHCVGAALQLCFELPAVLFISELPAVLFIIRGCI